MATCNQKKIMATVSNIDSLPQECVSKILSYTSPPDACRFSMVSSTLHSAADSDFLWRNFLPSDYKDIVSRTVNPLKLQSSSSFTYKQLFQFLCQHPLLLDRGNICFKLDKCSGKKSYILSARELSIAWSSDPLYWCWRSTPESRFQEVAELRTVNWLEIQGKIETRILTPNTSYTVYLIMKISHREYGLNSAPVEVSITVANKLVQSGRAYLCPKLDNFFHGNQKYIQEHETIVPSKREDGWMEIELGEFFCGEAEDEKVKISIMEVGYQLKAGLIIEGIEVRPR